MNSLLSVTAVGLVTRPNVATTAINSSAVNVLTGTPAINLGVVGTTDWLVMDASGSFGAPAIKDQKAGRADLAFSGSTGLFGGGSEDQYNAQWADGTVAPTFNGNTGYYVYFSDPATETFTAAIAAGETSTAVFYINSWIPASGSLTVKNASGAVLSTVTLPGGFNTRSEIVFNYSATEADVLTFEFSVSNGQLGVAAVGLVTGPTLVVSPLVQWRTAKFGSPDNTGNGADAADPDGDGIANLIEYSLGTEPLTANPSSAINVTTDTVRLSLQFSRIADPALTYGVEASNTLANGSWSPIWTSTGEANTAGPVTVPDVETLTQNPRRFLRLSVTY